MLMRSFWRFVAGKILPYVEINMNGKKIGGLPTSGFPTADGDVAHKKYVDDNIGAGTFLQLGDTPPSYEGEAAKFCKVNPGETALIFAAGVGIDTFVELTDVPANYTDQGGKVVRVKLAENGLEFIELAGGGDMLKSTYDPNDDGKVVDSDKLEGSTKAQVRAHSPQSHALNSHTAPTNHISMNGKKITSLGTPGNPTDGATKAYVDQRIW